MSISIHIRVSWYEALLLATVKCTPKPIVISIRIAGWPSSKSHGFCFYLMIAHMRSVTICRSGFHCFLGVRFLTGEFLIGTEKEITIRNKKKKKQQHSSRRKKNMHETNTQSNCQHSITCDWSEQTQTFVSIYINFSSRNGATAKRERCQLKFTWSHIAFKALKEI